MTRRMTVIFSICLHYFKLLVLAFSTFYLLLLHSSLYKYDSASGTEVSILFEKVGAEQSQYFYEPGFRLRNALRVTMPRHPVHHFLAYIDRARRSLEL